MSPGVVVLVKKSLREHFAPSIGRCVHDSNLYGGDKALTNTKGTVFLELFTVVGPLVAASTHGARGDVICEPRVQMIQGAVKQIMDMKPAIVAWGGDFNPRTQVNGDDDLLSLGATHPDTTSPTRVDPRAHWAPWFNATAAYEQLAATPDILGGADGKSLQQVLKEASGGHLMEVPLIRSLCPTYKKKSGGKFKDTDMMLLADGTKEQKGWFSQPQGSRVIEEWKPSFACQAPGSSDLEYYASPLDGKTEWPSRSPSWTERLVVHATAGTKCQRPRKVLAEDDHDVLYARCDLS